MLKFIKKNHKIEKISEEQAARVDIITNIYAYFRVERELDQYKLWLFFLISLPVLGVLIFDVFKNVKIIEIFSHLILIIPLGFLYYLTIYIYETKNKERITVMQNVIPKLNEVLYMELSKISINVFKNFYIDLKMSDKKWRVRRWVHGSLIIYTIVALVFLAWKTQITIDALFILTASDPYIPAFFVMFMVFSICMTRFYGNLRHQKRRRKIFLIIENVMEENKP